MAQAKWRLKPWRFKMGLSYGQQSVGLRHDFDRTIPVATAWASRVAQGEWLWHVSGIRHGSGCLKTSLARSASTAGQSHRYGGPEDIQGCVTAAERRMRAGCESWNVTREEEGSGTQGRQRTSFRIDRPSQGAGPRDISMPRASRKFGRFINQHGPCADRRLVEPRAYASKSRRNRW